MSGKRYLGKHGKQWRVQVRVLPKLQAVMGKKRLVVPPRPQRAIAMTVLFVVNMPSA